ncbi:hypothetical protein ACGYLO_18335 [Sulfitobacter sp. 1A13353]|uniref:hypothetical protein n=1 Tax=Sulfitobacter sp. 1A13353 TaxID=3368568 RepID=UPI0037458732
MTNKTENKAAQSGGGDETRTLGKRSDPKVKANNPQLSDKDKLGKAVSSIDDLSARMEQLDKSSGPFGNDEVDFKAGRVSSLLDDVPAAKPVPVARDEEDEVSLDDILGNKLPQEDAGDEMVDLADMEEDKSDLIETTPFMDNEKAALEDDDYSAAVDDFLSDIEAEGLWEEEETDPIDEMVDEDIATVDEEESPFAALFTPVDGDEDALFDAGVQETDSTEPEGSVDQETVDFDDDSLFFDDEVDIHVSKASNDHVTATLPGAGTFADQEDDAIYDDLNNDDETGSGEEDPSSGLPQLTMGEDDGIYAPGTDYADEEVAHTSEERDFADSFGSDEDPVETDKTMKKDDAMATSEYGSDEDQTNLKTLEAVEDGQDDNTFDADDIDAFKDDEVAASDEGSFEGDDLDDLLNDNEASAEDEDADVEDAETSEVEDDTSDDAADAIFGDDDEEDTVEASTEGPVLVADTQEHDTVALEKSEQPAEAAVAEEITGEEAPAAPAKKKPLKAALLAAASFAILGGVGLAAWNGAIPGVDLNPAAGYPPNAIEVTDTGEAIDEPAQVASVDIDLEEPMSPITPEAAKPEGKGTIRLADLMGAKAEDTTDEPIAPTDLSDLMDAEEPSEDLGDAEVVAMEEAPVVDVPDLALINDDTVEIADPIEVDVADIDADLVDPVDAPEDQPDLVVVEAEPADELDPISALAAEISNATGKVADEPEEAAEDEATSTTSVFVGEERVAEVEADVSEISKNIEALTEEVSKMNALMVQTMERSSTIATRVESNERSLRTVTAILTEFTGVRESLDQTQIVLLDIAARVGSLEASNPANKQEVGNAIKEINGELKRLTANMAILARMTVNGVSALEAPNASAGNHGVQTSNSGASGAGTDKVFADDTETFRATTPPSGVVPADVENGDFVEGYGYVLDVIPASGNQNLVVMENGSVLVPK